eukprot:6081431-Alexandrium_andersonii.AAC.1
MERRLLRDPIVRTPSGGFRLLAYTSIRPAQQGLARPGLQASALAEAVRARGGGRRARKAELCLVVERSPADAAGRSTTGAPV